MTHWYRCLFSSVDKCSRSNHSNSSGQTLEIDRKCEYDQQPTNGSGYQFVLYAKDLILHCDKEASNQGKMDTPSARDHSASVMAQTQMSEFNRATPSVHRYEGCHSIWTAHQKRRPQVHLALNSSLINRDG